MRYRHRSFRRRGVTVMEGAAVYPVTLFFIIGMLVGSLGVFRFQQVASLAREGARWASVRGSDYAEASGKPAATAPDVYDKAIAPLAVALDQSKLTYAVTWSPDNRPPNSSVTVTVTYQWIPEAYLVGPITLTSSSTAKMAY